MGTREQCNKCGAFFIIGQESEVCPHGNIEDEDDAVVDDDIAERFIKEHGWHKVDGYKADVSTFTDVDYLEYVYFAKEDKDDFFEEVEYWAKDDEDDEAVFEDVDDVIDCIEEEHEDDESFEDFDAYKKRMEDEAAEKTDTKAAD